jgi:hypothetical protein
MTHRRSFPLRRASFWRRLAALLVMAAAVQGDDLPGQLPLRSVLAKAEAERSRENPAGWGRVDGKFEVDGNVAGQTSFICQYATPAPGGKASPRAGEATFYFHTPGDKNPLASSICDRLVRESGMTVFSIIFGPSSDVGLYFDQQRKDQFYGFAKSGSFAVITKAWRMLSVRCGLPGNDFFLYGYSAGGIGVQRFAEESPSLCAGVVSVCGHTFIVKRGATCPMLVIHTIGDGGEAEGDGLARYYRSIQTPCIRLLMAPNWGLLAKGETFSFHALHPAVGDLTLRFIEGIVDLRREHGGVITDHRQTSPYVVNPELPRQVMATKNADWMRLDAGRSAPALMPSARFYKELVALPLPTRVVDHPQAGHLLYALPAASDAQPIGVAMVWYGGLASATGDASVWETAIGRDLRYVIDRDFIAAAAARSPSSVEATFPLIDAESPRASRLPLVALMVDPSREDLADAIAMKRVRAVAVLADPSAELGMLTSAMQTLAAARRKGKVFIAVENEKEGMQVLQRVPEPLRGTVFVAIAGPEAKTREVFRMATHQRQLEAAVDFVLTAIPAP